jgi:hypothetical protein
VGRLVLTTFHVTTLTDGVAGSLRDAVSQANTHAGADTIVFGPGLTGTIALNDGELNITDDLTIRGPGAANLTVSGNHLSRVLKVEAGETVKISGLTIAGGDAGGGNGGGIDNAGTLTVSNSVFSGNTAANGGGLANESGGTATVRDCSFTDNSADSRGGGIFNGGAATVNGSTFSGNSARGGGGLDNSGTATVRDSSFSDNSAVVDGGGLFNEPFATATVRDCSFSGNSALFGGGLENDFFGEMTLTGSTLTDNSAGIGEAASKTSVRRRCATATSPTTPPPLAAASPTSGR